MRFIIVILVVAVVAGAIIGGVLTMLGPSAPTSTEVQEQTIAAAGQGNAESQFTLGQMYFDGEGVDQDRAEAMSWYRKAAEQGHALAQLALAVEYHRGEETGRDRAEAVVWYRRAAEAKVAEAQYYLGVLMHAGLGAETGRATVVELYRAAAEQGFVPAQTTLGLMHFFGGKEPENYADALDWLLRLSKRGAEGEVFSPYLLDDLG